MTIDFRPLNTSDNSSRLLRERALADLVNREDWATEVPAGQPLQSRRRSLSATLKAGFGHVAAMIVELGQGLIGSAIAIVAIVTAVDVSFWAMRLVFGENAFTRGSHSFEALFPFEVAFVAFVVLALLAATFRLWAALAVSGTLLWLALGYPMHAIVALLGLIALLLAMVVWRLTGRVASSDGIRRTP